jgi:phosphopantetheinyl transferase (holo-ACP synthase)
MRKVIKELYPKKDILAVSHRDLYAWFSVKESCFKALNYLHPSLLMEDIQVTFTSPDSFQFSYKGSIGKGFFLIYQSRVLAFAFL